MKNRGGDTETRRHGNKLSRVAALPRQDVPIITLLTDFGTSDYFVGAVKGAIFTVNPAARVVDITHEIPPHDIESAAFTLLATVSAFPAGTIHVAVVDPGVGSARRGILIQTGDKYLVGPDNGIFSYVCDKPGDTGVEVFHLDNDKYFRRPVSHTFHGRDIFGPVAAALSTGIKPNKLGTRIDDFVRLPSIAPKGSRTGEITARIIHIDRFGNCITSLTPADLPEGRIAAGVRLQVNGKTVRSFRDFFADKNASRDQLFGIWGSAGFLEIAAENKSAADLLKAKRGDAVVVTK